ncbi:MAG: carboxypeptidase regulatory-like domain-containing protein [Planctomycetes bacterium]|nr:carboxypeptidase regulatory-like domain-containing protein [Planctomycetota bacterium]
MCSSDLMEAGHRISGTVFDPSGAPLEEARVKVNLVGARPKTAQVTLTDKGILTDANGFFSFDSLEGGEHRLVVSHDDYATYQQMKVPVDGTDLSITLAEGGAISGVVTDAATGVPIPGATVTVHEPAGVMKKATTESDGKYFVRGITSDGRRNEARLGCEAKGFARQGGVKATVDEGAVSEGVDFALDRNGTVTGFVIDTTGKRVSGARVEVKRKTDSSMPLPVTVGGPTTSGPDGSFTIDNVAPGEAGMIVADHNNYLETEGEPFDLAPGESLTGFEIALRIGGMVSGSVVDDHNQPVQGATVAIRDERYGDISLDSLESKTKTDASGRFTIGSVESGEVSLIAHRTGYLRTEISGIKVNEGQNTEGIVFQLVSGSTLSGIVTDSSGMPIVGAKITVIDTSDGLNKPTRRTDSNGFYEFDELGQYEVQVNVEKEGYSKEQRSEVPVNSENNDFVLRRLGSLRGIVTNQHGEPLRTFSVSPSIEENGRMLRRQPARTFNSEDGSFDYPSLNAGNYQIVVGCPGFAAVTVPDVVIQEDFETNLGTIVLNEGGKVGGYVLDAETGEPVFGATVSILNGTVIDNPFSGNQAGGRPSRRRGGVAGRQRTDKEGHFMIEGLAEEVVTVEVEHRNYVKTTVELRAGMLEAEVFMSRGGVIDGQVVSSTSGEELPGIQLFLTGNGQSDRQVTDRKGNFTFSGLQDGSYQIRVTNFGMVGSGKQDVRNAPTYDVAVSNGQAAFLRIEYDGPAGREREN